MWSGRGWRGRGPALSVAPTSPWQNGHAESFHSRLRDECPDREEFEREPQAHGLDQLRKEESSTGRPHNSLDYQIPAEYAAKCRRRVTIRETPTEPPPMYNRAPDSDYPSTKKSGEGHVSSRSVTQVAPSPQHESSCRFMPSLASRLGMRSSLVTL
jgi:hypothetical protein